MRKPTMQQAKDRWHTHTRKVLSEPAKRLLSDSINWGEDLEGPFVRLGGRLTLRFWLTSCGNNVYATTDSAPRD